MLCTYNVTTDLWIVDQFINLKRLHVNFFTVWPHPSNGSNATLKIDPKGKFSITKSSTNLPSSAQKPTSFFDPAKHQFKERLTPLMFKKVKAHECLCIDCNAEFYESVLGTAEAEALAAYDREVTTEARSFLYKEAIERYRNEMEQAAVKEIREEIREELLADDVKEHRKQVRKEVEEQWVNEQRAALRKEVEKDYELML